MQRRQGLIVSDSFELTILPAASVWRVRIPFCEPDHDCENVLWIEHAISPLPFNLPDRLLVAPIIEFRELRIEYQPMRQVDEMAPLERGAQFLVL